MHISSAKSSRNLKLQNLVKFDALDHSASARFCTCVRFGRWKSPPPSVKNFFRGIPFSHKDKVHEHIQESLLLGRRTNGNFACFFRSFLQVFDRGFLQKISYFDGKE